MDQTSHDVLTNFIGAFSPEDAYNWEQLVASMIDGSGEPERLDNITRGAETTSDQAAVGILKSGVPWLTDRSFDTIPIRDL
jgi:hypothetical protein